MNKALTSERKITIGYLGGFEKKEEISIILESLPLYRENNLQFICLETNHKEFETSYKKYAEKYPENIHTTKDPEMILKKCDAILFADTSSIHLESALKKQIIPIISETNTFQNFNAQKETGNAFLYTKGSFWNCVSAILRASLNYEFSYDWSLVKKNLKKKNK